MKKYFQIVNRVFLGLLILIILFHHRAPNAEAQFDGPMLDSGDGYGVMPGKNISPTSSAKFLKEAENIYKNINEFKFEDISATPPNLSPTSFNYIPTEPMRSLTTFPTLSVFPTTSIFYNNKVGDLINLITRDIHRNCTEFGAGIVKKTNNDCVEGISAIIGPVNGAATVAHIKTSTGVVNDPNSPYYETLQCVGCAVAMAQANNKPYSGIGDAKNHINQSVSNYRYVSNARLTPMQRAGIPPGSLFITSEGTYGHIGTIVKVNVDSDGGARFFIAQDCNWGIPGYFGLGRIIPFAQVAGFQIPIN